MFARSRLMHYHSIALDNILLQPSTYRCTIRVRAEGSSVRYIGRKVAWCAARLIRLGFQNPSFWISYYSHYCNMSPTDNDSRWQLSPINDTLTARPSYTRTYDNE